jgi:carboxymethylenebutenolidase
MPAPRCGLSRPISCFSYRTGAGARGADGSNEGAVGEFITLTAADRHVLDAYQAVPAAGAIKGGLVVVQEAFGVTPHIQAVCRSFADAGYHAVAPALYDRQRRQAVFTYDEEGMAAARVLREGLRWDETVRDVGAAASSFPPHARVGLVGFCVGGTVGWLAAARLPLAAVVCYYGTDIFAFREQDPACPTLLHFAENDRFIPPAHVEGIRERHPRLPVHVHAGEHGFNCDSRPQSYRADSAAAALAQTLDFFARHVAA